MTTTYAQAETKYVTVNGVKLAYRLIGDKSGTPLLFNMHFRGTMDHWDPNLIDTIAKKRPVLLFDNAGVGFSEGDIPEEYDGWAEYAIGLLKALNYKEADVLGFSMGGFVAQLIAIKAPKIVRRLILAGTGPSLGEGLTSTPPDGTAALLQAKTLEETRTAFLKYLYTKTPSKQEKASQWWERINNSRPGHKRSDYVDSNGAQRQITAMQAFFTPGNEEKGTYNRLDKIRAPTLIANGSNDVLIHTKNSFVLWERIDNAPTHLHIYPDAGHGFLFEYSDRFAAEVNDFLDKEV